MCIAHSSLSYLKGSNVGRETTEDNACPGWPCMLKIYANIQKIGQLIHENHLSIRTVAELTVIDKESVS